MLGVGRAGPLGPVVGTAAAGGEPHAAGADTGACSPAPAGSAGSSRRASPHQAPGPPDTRDRHRIALDEREAWAVLASIDGLGPVSFGVLLRAFGSARAVLAAAAGRRGPARLAAAAAAEDLRLAPDVAAAAARARDDAPGLLARLRDLGVAAVTAEEERYPRRLRAIELPPPVLFVAGGTDALDSRRAVAIVGTRRPTDDGRRAAARLAAVVAATGGTVVSGLAVGIDGAAHAGALDGEGFTVGVLGSGHGRLYPSAHARLAAEIVATGGAVVTELPPDAEPRPAGFPRRNRIIAGLSDATIVVEAGERSGALITASWAMEQGRAVFAVPGPIDRPQSVGCNRLLRAHPGEVRIVAGPDELVEDLGYGTALPVRRLRPSRSEAPRPDPGAVVARLAPAEASVARRLLAGPATADALAAGADLATATVLAVLTRLEEEGLVAAAFGRYRAAGALAGVRPLRRAASREDRDP